MNLGIESSPSATVVGLIETDALYGQFPYPVVQSGTNKKTTVTAARGGHDFPRPAPDIGNRAWLAAVLLVLLAGGYHRLFRPGTKIAQAELPKNLGGK
jgi:hypothetical protein